MKGLLKSVSRKTASAAKLLPLLLLALPVAVNAQFTYVTNNGTITITGYTGTATVVSIPDTINSLPVTSIGTNAFYTKSGLTSVMIGTNVISVGNYAFYHCSGLTNVTVPNSVISIGYGAFWYCSGLTNVAIPGNVTNIGARAFFNCNNLKAIAVNSSNLFYSSTNGALFNKSQTTLIQCPGSKAGGYAIPEGVLRVGADAFFGCTKLTGVSIPNSVTSIGNGAFGTCIQLADVIIGRGVTNIEAFAFESCFCLTRITIPASVASIGNYAFAGCDNLTEVYSAGKAPSIESAVFEGDYSATIYYLPWQTGWTNPWAGRPTMPWNPVVQTSGATFGMQTNSFGFDITGISNLIVVVEACTDLTAPVWTPLSTNILASGTARFIDPKWTNYPSRIYRLRAP